jgi:hypothetical protein
MIAISWIEMEKIKSKLLQEGMFLHRNSQFAPLNRLCRWSSTNLAQFSAY